MLLLDEHFINNFCIQLFLFLQRIIHYIEREKRKERKKNQNVFSIKSNGLEKKKKIKKKKKRRLLITIIEMILFSIKKKIKIQRCNDSRKMNKAFFVF
jgi:hypothetical protein